MWNYSAWIATKAAQSAASSSHNSYPPQHAPPQHAVLATSTEVSASWDGAAGGFVTAFPGLNACLANRHHGNEDEGGEGEGGVTTGTTRASSVASSSSSSSSSSPPYIRWGDIVDICGASPCAPVTQFVARGIVQSFLLQASRHPSGGMVHWLMTRTATSAANLNKILAEVHLSAFIGEGGGDGDAERGARSGAAITADMVRCYPVQHLGDAFVALNAIHAAISATVPLMPHLVIIDHLLDLLDPPAPFGLPPPLDLQPAVNTTQPPPPSGASGGYLKQTFAMELRRLVRMPTPTCPGGGVVAPVSVVVTTSAQQVAMRLETMRHQKSQPLSLVSQLPFRPTAGAAWRGVADVTVLVGDASLAHEGTHNPQLPSSLGDGCGYAVPIVCGHATAWCWIH